MTLSDLQRNIERLNIDVEKLIKKKRLSYENIDKLYDKKHLDTVLGTVSRPCLSFRIRLKEKYDDYEMSFFMLSSENLCPFSIDNDTIYVSKEIPSKTVSVRDVYSAIFSMFIVLIMIDNNDGTKKEFSRTSFTKFLLDEVSEYEEIYKVA